MASIAEYLKKILVDVFRPELLNRFSDIIVFRDLKPNELDAIVRLRLKELAELLEEKLNVILVYTPQVTELIVKLGYDPSFGARPISRVIRDKIREPLSEKIISGEIKRGNRVLVDVVGEEIAISSTGQ